MKVGNKDISEYKRYMVCSPTIGLERGSVLYEGIDYGEGGSGSYWTEPPGLGGLRVAPSQFVEGSHNFDLMEPMTESEYNKAYTDFLKKGING